MAVFVCDLHKGESHAEQGFLGDNAFEVRPHHSAFHLESLVMGWCDNHAIGFIFAELLFTVDEYTGYRDIS